jgi:hypothetical protein
MACYNQKYLSIKTNKMKQFIIIIFTIITTHFLHAQGVGIGTSAPNSKALLDISSITQGVLFPRMTSTQRFNINTPPNGLMVYDTDKNELYQYNGIFWRAILNNEYWQRPITNRKRITNSVDSIGIGTNSPTEWLDVDGNIRSRNNLIANNNVTATGSISGGALTTSGNLFTAGTSFFGGDITTNSDININNTAATLQLKSSNTNKGFFQINGDDVRLGTNSGNTLGNAIIRLDGNDRFKFDKNGRFTLQAAATPTMYFASGGINQAFLQV